MDEVWLLKVVTEAADEYMWAFSHPPYPGLLDDNLERIKSLLTYREKY